MNPFDEMYEGTPPWDIGRPQRAFVDLHAQGRISGRVLDVGCGTGDLVNWLAEQGVDAIGVDASGRAIERARRKAGPTSRARFRVFDVLRIEGMRTVFDTVLDCGMMHGLTDAGWTAYAAALSRVLRPGGMLHVLCFSDAEPAWGGPRRVRQEELRALFRGGWWIDELHESRFETLTSDDGARAWLCSVEWHGHAAPGVQ